MARGIRRENNGVEVRVEFPANTDIEIFYFRGQGRSVSALVCRFCEASISGHSKVLYALGIKNWLNVYCTSHINGSCPFTRLELGTPTWAGGRGTARRCRLCLKSPGPSFLSTPKRPCERCELTSIDPSRAEHDEYIVHLSTFRGEGPRRMVFAFTASLVA